jgi:hypothetical protein
LYQARLPDGRVAATQLVLLGTHPVTHTVCAGAEPQWQKLGTTPYLRWKVFEDLAEAGYAGNDLTDAALNPVTRFKSQLGTELTMNLVVSRPDKWLYNYGRDLTRLIRRVNMYVRRRVPRRSQQGSR